MKLILIFTTCFVLSGCMLFQSTQSQVVPREIVLEDGMKICATDDIENICITAKGFTKRIILWEGEFHSITLIPRKKRWNGKLGLTSPTPPENIWKTKNGFTRVIMNENQIKCDNLEDVLKELRSPFARKFGRNMVYNDNGLLIMWCKSVLPDQNVLSLSIYQIIINGKKPSSIPGSQNHEIVITQ